MDQERRDAGGADDPAVYEAFVELRQERRLDTNRVLLYKGKPIQI
jgi:hypothetical protein